MDCCCRKGLLCDVILVADNDVELPAHRAVLAACSHYFYAMFTSKLSESRSDKVTLKQIEGPALELLVNFMYTSDIKIVEENVQVRMYCNLQVQIINQYPVGNGKYS